MTSLSGHKRTLSQIETALGFDGLSIDVKPRRLGTAKSPLSSYRYVWRLQWDDKKRSLLVVGLMPSTADKQHADATVAKLIAIASNGGFGELVVTNMFARWPMPDHKRASADLDFVNALGPDKQNDKWIERMANEVRGNRGTIAVAWGGDGWSRHGHVLSVLGDGDLYCFGTTQRPGKRATSQVKQEPGFPRSASRSGVREDAKQRYTYPTKCPSFDDLTDRKKNEPPG